MNLILSEILKLRNNVPIIPDRANKNKYCIISNDSNLKTAYCFGVPIYNSQEHKLLDLCFQKFGSSWSYRGSSSELSISNVVSIKNAEGSFTLDLFDGDVLYETDHSLHYKQTDLNPTTNGLLIKKECLPSSNVKVKITASKPFLPIWSNDRCFCFMKSDFEPLLSLSCIGASIDAVHISNPIKIWHTKVNDYEYIFEFINTNPLAKYIHFEVNMYEKKLLQDTTVESKNPSMNNVYGTTAFIGTTSLLGEQWLYARLDYTLISEFFNQKIENVIVHLPALNISNTNLQVYNVANRFCSFGSNWDNKIPISVQITNPLRGNNYYSLDISSLIIDPITKYLKKSEGFILKPKEKNGGFAVMTTGDSFFAPVIIEIRYR